MLSCKWLSHCRCHIFRILGCKVKYVSSLLFWHDGLYYCQWIILFHADTAQRFIFSKLNMKLWMTISYESLKVDKKQKDYWLIVHYLISYISWPNGLKWHKHRKKAKILLYKFTTHLFIMSPWHTHSSFFIHPLYTICKGLISHKNKKFRRRKWASQLKSTYKEIF